LEHVGADQVYRGDVKRLLATIADERGIDLTQYRGAYVERRIAARLRALNLHTYRQYARYLQADPKEFASLLDALTINVTDFFRDPPVYQVFRTRVVPEIIERKVKTRHRVIRVWSAGCATGEEPYSIAMSFLSALGPLAADFTLHVVGTDLDPKALETAARAEYDIAKLKHIPKTDQVRFVDVGTDTFRIKPEVTKHVRFSPLNLFTDEPIHVVDVLFCRNVFIYFTREQQARVISRFSEALARGGYLVLGRSEKMSTASAAAFELVEGRDRVYRRR
jgi:chemotaxis methyl-accepting protein methylase